MRLESAFNAGREGIITHGQAISVIGDNISNSSTTGFKTSRTEFSDMISDGVGGLQSTNIEYGGTGVELNKVRTMIKTGGVIEPTGRSLDLAIDGNGFFMTGAADNQRYTRAGNFDLDLKGNLVSQNGQGVLGYQAGSTTLGPLNLYNLGGTTGAATTLANMSGNIDASLPVATKPTNPATFNDVASAATFVAPITVYDSLGARRELSVAFFKNSAGTYDMTAYADGKDTGGTKGTPVAIGTTTIKFDENGQITGNASLTASANWTNGAAPGNFTLNASGFTQYATASGLNATNQDGKPVGAVSDYEFDKNGDIYAVLDSGSRTKVGTIALANFTNVDGLERAGSTEFAATEAAGAPIIGAPNSGALGTIEGSALERSTTDISEEFVNLILYQRGYQANSQSLSSANDLLKETIQLIR